jgi:hypothetical protein
MRPPRLKPRHQAARQFIGLSNRFREDGQEAGSETEAKVGYRGWVGRAPLGTAGIVLGVASVVGNMVYNCWACGWDPHDAPWYEALLVAGVPLLAAPILTLVGLTWALVARTWRVIIDVLLMTLGMALPWVYWMVGSRFVG